MDTKLWRMLAYLKGVLHIKSHHASVTWPCRIMWQTKTIISQLQQSLWPPLGNVVTHLAELPPIKSLDCLITWSCKITWKTKLLYLHYHSAYDNQTLQDADLLPETPIFKVTWPFDHLTDVTNLEKSVSPISQYLWSLNLAGCWLQGGVSARPCLSHHWLFIYLLVTCSGPIFVVALKYNFMQAYF